MRILLLHPEDSPRSGPWAQQKWDLLVDLGKCSEWTAHNWQEHFRCPVLRLDAFRCPKDDIESVRKILYTGRGLLLDSEGLDWWELTGLLLEAELECATALQRLAREILGKHELYASRSGWPIDALARILQSSAQCFPHSKTTRLVKRYSEIVKSTPLSQLAEIAFDKYDPEYNWRRIFASRRRRAKTSVVLVPSAYTNVSRMAAAYARLLPEEQFLFVTTRRSGTQFQPVPNVKLASLASYGPQRAGKRELPGLLLKWNLLRNQLLEIPAVQILSASGKLNNFPGLFRYGLAVRDLWREVLKREPVSAVLCGDDSNRYTRIPVLLARSRGLPTVDFHHGALDGRFLLKTLPSDLYLAKNQMERDYLIRVCGVPAEKISLGGPLPSTRPSHVSVTASPQPRIVLFSEPYESAGARAEEIYRELVPALAQLARQSGTELTIKLHPFESVAQRRRLLRSILKSEDLAFIRLIEGPLSPTLLAEAWFGVTVESSTVLDCALQGVPCCVCRWLSLSPYGYVDQYSRFGIGLLLNSPQQIASIPLILANARKSPPPDLSHLLEPSLLRRYLAGMGTMVDAGEERRPAVAN